MKHASIVFPVLIFSIVAAGEPVPSTQPSTPAQRI